MKTLYPNFENVTAELWKRYIRTLKMLYPNFENITSELWKRYIRTLKTLQPNFENVTSELWKCYIRTLKTLHPNFENVIYELWKRYIRTLKTLHLNFENVISEYPLVPLSFLDDNVKYVARLYARWKSWEKWTTQWDCQLKKLPTVIVWLFSLREKAPTKKTKLSVVCNVSNKVERTKIHTHATLRHNKWNKKKQITKKLQKCR